MTRAEMKRLLDVLDAEGVTAGQLKALSNELLAIGKENLAKARRYEKEFYQAIGYLENALQTSERILAKEEIQMAHDQFYAVYHSLIDIYVRNDMSQHLDFLDIDKKAFDKKLAAAK